MEKALLTIQTRQNLGQGEEVLPSEQHMLNLSQGEEGLPSEQHMLNLDQGEEGFPSEQNMLIKQRRRMDALKIAGGRVQMLSCKNTGIQLETRRDNWRQPTLEESHQ